MLATYFTTRQIAEQISGSRRIEGTVCEWQVRRLFEDGDLRDPPRFGGKRLLTADQIPFIVDALQARGWLPAPDAAAEQEAAS